MATEREDAEVRSDTFRPSVDEVRADAVLDQLRRAGISTLEEFAEHYAAAVSASMVTNPRSADMFRPPAGQLRDLPERRTSPPPKHRPSTMPMSIDGGTPAEDEIQRYEKAHVHLVVDKQTEESGVVSGFTNPGDRDDYITGQEQPETESQSFAATSSVANDTGYCYENTGFGGSALRIPRMNDWWNYTLDDLTRYYRSCFLWWCWNPWNDIISSVRAESHWIVVYEHIYLQGSSLSFYPWSQWPDLSPLGWNDRISSLKIIP